MKQKRTLWIAILIFSCAGAVIALATGNTDSFAIILSLLAFFLSLLAFLFCADETSKKSSFSNKIGEREENNEVSDQKVIIYLFYEQQSIRAFLISTMSFMLVLAYAIVLSLMHPEDASITYEKTSQFTIWALAILSVISHIRLFIIEYRIRKGFYGNNRHEARELIRFIEKNSEDFKPPGGGPNRKAFPDRKPLEDKQINDDAIGEKA